VSDNFDSGPLTWVKDQINQLLESVLLNVDTVQNNIHDMSPMRLSQTSLYQASGALDMVGLEGCKRFSSELEKLAGKLEKKTVNATPQIIDDFANAVRTLQKYLQDLLNGSPDIPLRLYPVLKPIVDVQGEMLEESELFFPDTSNSAPKTIPFKELSESDYAAYILEQRAVYQKALLAWLQTKEVTALENMTTAVRNVSQTQQKNSDKTLWWVASAFTEALEQKEIAENPGAKKLCRKLDQELRLFADGVKKPHGNLMRDILYYVAISDVDKEDVLKVKEIFELDQLVDKKSAVNYIGGNIDADEIAYVNQLIDELAKLKDIWEDISKTIDFSKLDSDTYKTVPIDKDLISKFSDTVSTSHAITQNLTQVLLVDVYSVLQQASNTLRDDASKVNHAALIEMAAALNIIESSLKNYQQLDAERMQRLYSEVMRLESISSGEGYDRLEEDRASELDRETVKAIVIHINESLKIVEQALDSYFRNPDDKAPLSLTAQPLSEVSGVFDMLGLPTPTAISNASKRFVHLFEQNDYVVNQADFELVAESLSMLGLYADEMPKIRPEAEMALENALQRLNDRLGHFVTSDTPEEITLNIDTEVDAEEYLLTNKIKEIKAEQEAQPSASLVDMDSGDKITDQAFDDELLDIYLTEAEEVLAHIAQNCQALRVNATNHYALVEVRRSFHTLKGSGRTVGLSALGEVAGKVEFFLNDILDEKEHLNMLQIAAIEQVSAAFAGWTAELRANSKVEVNQDPWFKRIAEFPHLTDKPVVSEEVVSSEELASSASVNPRKKSSNKKTDPHVLIGGTRKMSRALYDIFLNESLQNIKILEDDVVQLTDGAISVPSKTARQANHTLASNALAAEFKQMGELGRALEHWLDEICPIWSPQHLVLYSNVIKNLSKMWKKISELDHPRSANALIKVLAEATQLAMHNKTSPAEPLENTEVELTAPTNSEMVAAYDLTFESIEELSDDNQLIDEEVSDIEVKLITQGMDYQQRGGLNKDNVDNELLNMFLEEAHEIMPELGSELRAWRANPKEMQHPDALQRALHTLKGSARMAGQTELGDSIHELEEQVTQALKRKNEAADFDLMFVELDKIGSYFEESKEVETDDEVTSTQEDVAPAGRTTDRKAQFLRMRADTLDRLINEAGEISIIRSRLDRELTGFKQSSNDLTESVSRLRNYLRELEIEAETQLQSRLNILQETNETFDPLEFDRFTRLQELTRMIAESVNDVATIQGALLGNLDQSEAALQQQNRMNRDLQQSLLSARMLPFKQISERMQRIVRQTARELKKSVDLVIDGEATEIDRSVLDKLGAPLEHLLRNAVAHGIETPAERRKIGKPEMGVITLKVSQANDEININVNDDGAGINLKRIRDKAIKNKILSPDAEISEQALMSLIFETGFSTAEKVSQIAGRGVGMDVVRNDVSGLGGRVDLDSEFGKGTTFNVQLPVTLSVTQVLAVRSGDTIYALPVTMIQQAQKIKRLDLIDAYKAGEIVWADNKYPLHYLSKLLHHQDHQPEDHAYVSVLLLRSAQHNIALHVDEVIGNQEAVMKPIGAQLARVPGIVGATVAGDGRVILIINPVQLANLESLAAGSVVVKAPKAKVAKVAVKRRVLVVDDSLTMRKVLARLLEREGFEVIVAKDGLDAMQLLQETTPDAILTDIEMPRMDGFGLARNIRDDARTMHTPLIMISSRTADKHQNLAKEIGVDAFFGKPVQDDDLINKVNELINSKRVLH
jgi:chemosensory pili system protein ChpA (sensor histidine kinase/response regulator)